MQGPKRLTKEEALAAKALWSEIFYEDSPQFTDYYFEEKMQDNTGYGFLTDGELAAMLFLTPYTGCICGNGRIRETPLFYIVGVGTKREYRRRGYMGSLLREALRGLHRDGVPFAFLMPADPAIYLPYGFRYIYDRPSYRIRPDKDFPPRPLEPGEEGALADFAQEQMARRFQLFLKRDTAYYIRQKKESRAQDGDVYVFEENGRIAGYYLYACEEGKEFIQEAAVSEALAQRSVLKLSEKREPIIMARIANAAAMLSLVRLSPQAGEESVTLRLWVDDPLIEGNRGAYLWTVGKKESTIALLEKTDTGEVRARIDGLAEFLFGRKSCRECFERVRADTGTGGCSEDDGVYAKLSMIEPLARLCLNEIV